MEFESRLEQTIRLIEGYYNSNEFCTTYSFTTENISGYLKYFDLKDKSLLTVGSSGDQILNAYFYGARDITLIDKNPIAKDYIWLKICSILCLDYDEFQKFFFKRGLNNQAFNKYMYDKEVFDNMIKDTLRLFDYDSYLLFDEIFHLFDKERIREYLMDDDEFRNKVINSFNIYLRNEKTYNILKSRLKNICFKFIYGDIYEINIDRKFDNIFLSNLCTVTSVDSLKELIKKLKDNNLNTDGKMLIAYLWGTNYNQSNYKDDWLDVYKLPITKEKIGKYITEYHQIKGAHNFLWEENKKDDLVLIYHNKKKV